MMVPPFIVVAGNIASGKTALATRAAEKLDVPYFAEEWAANPFFERYYREPRRWALHTHLHFVVTAAHAHRQDLKDRGGVQDRSLYEVNAIFGHELARQGHLEPHAAYLCHTLVDMLLTDQRNPDLLVILDCPVPVLLERAATRGRPGEHLDHDYLAALGRRYDDFGNAWDLSPVVRIDSHSLDFRAPDGLAEAMSKITDKLEYPR